MLQIIRWDTDEVIVSNENVSSIKELLELGVKQGVSFYRAQLNDAQLNGALLNGARLNGAQLNRAELNDAKLNGAELNDAELNDAELNRAQLDDALLNGARLNDAQLDGARLNGARLNGAELNDAELNGARLYGAELNRAQLNRAQLNRAQLNGAQLNDAELNGAQLNRAQLDGAQLNGADLSGAIGLLSASEWLQKNCEQDEYGYIVYKRFGATTYSSPKQWIVEKGQYITEVADSSRTITCGCGINVGTLAWCTENYTSEALWKCRIRVRNDDGTFCADLAGVIVPYNTDGKFRCERLELLEPIKV
jgi:uncharacterized protein YjbI with pentapeptide repeats